MSTTVQAGAAQPVVVAAGGPVEGGAAVPVYGYASAATLGKRALGGGPAQRVHVLADADMAWNGGRYTLQARAAVPMVLATAGAPAEGGPAIPVYVVAGAPLTGAPEPVLSGASFALQNTTATNDMGADGYTWAQGFPIVVDQYNNLILWAQRYNSTATRHVPVVSGDGGATWSEPARTGFFDAAGEGFLARGCAAYDSVNDLLHVLWNGLAASDGIIYRRYAFTRDGSHKITGMTRVAGINLQLDLQTTGTMQYEHPVLIWIPQGGANGSVVCLWAARNTGTGSGSNKNELRASMRVLSNDANDNTAGNWIAPNTADTTGIGNAPAVAYSIMLQNNTGGIPYFSAQRKAALTHAGDLYLFYWDGAAANGGTWTWRRLKWNAGTVRWTDGLTTPAAISNLQVAGADSGYGLKYQLGSLPQEDSVLDRMYFAFPRWLSNAAGDTWSFVYVDAADALSGIVDVYSAGGPHSYAPTGDIAFDNVAGRLAVSYDKTAGQAVGVQLYNGTAQTMAELVAFNTAPFDIPLLYTRFAGALLVLGRDTLNTPVPPYHGWFGTLQWS